MATSKKIKLGEKYRDKITGFSGTCTGLSQYISGCDQALLVPPVKDDGTYIAGNWFDDDRLVEAKSGTPVKRTSKKGGPQSHPAPTN